VKFAHCLRIVCYREGFIRFSTSEGNFVLGNLPESLYEYLFLSYFYLCRLNFKSGGVNGNFLGKFLQGSNYREDLSAEGSQISRYYLKSNQKINKKLSFFSSKYGAILELVKTRNHYGYERN